MLLIFFFFAFGLIVAEQSAKATSGPIEDLIAQRKHRYFILEPFGLGSMHFRTFLFLILFHFLKLVILHLCDLTFCFNSI